MFKIAWSVIGLLYLIVFWVCVYYYREGGSWLVQGWLNSTFMKEENCPVCKGHGWMVLREVSPGVTAYTPLPRWEEGDRYHEPDDGNAIECDACGGTGNILRELSKSEYFRKLPFAVFHRRW